MERRTRKSRNLDSGIMSAVCRGQVSDFSSFGQTAVAAKCLKVPRRAAEIPANLPRTRMYCGNVDPYLRSRSQTVFGPLRHEVWPASLTGAFFLRRRFGVEGSTRDVWPDANISRICRITTGASGPKYRVASIFPRRW